MSKESLIDPNGTFGWVHVSNEEGYIVGTVPTLKSCPERELRFKGDDTVGGSPRKLPNPPPPDAIMEASDREWRESLLEDYERAAGLIEPEETEPTTSSLLPKPGEKIVGYGETKFREIYEEDLPEEFRKAYSGARNNFYDRYMVSHLIYIIYAGILLTGGACFAVLYLGG